MRRNAESSRAISRRAVKSAHIGITATWSPSETHCVWWPQRACLVEDRADRAAPIGPFGSARVNCVVSGLEVVVQPAFLLKCGFRACKIVEFEMRIPLGDVLLKSCGHVAVRPAYIIDVKGSIDSLSKSVAACRYVRYGTSNASACETVWAAKAGYWHI